MNLDELLSYADAWQKAGTLSDVDEIYEKWLKSTNSPYKFVGYFNYGVLLAGWGRNEDAIENYNKALELNPSFPHPRINLGLTYERLGKNSEAIAYWKQVIEDPSVQKTPGMEMQTTALNHTGRLLEQLKDYGGAEKALTDSLEINPNQSDALHHWFHLRQKQCKWPILDGLPRGTTKNQVLRSMSPLAALAFDDDPAYQMFVAEKIVRDKFTYPVEPLSEKGRIYNHKRLRIGYLSGDLCTHAVGLLLPELFELHEKSKFEIYAYDYGREDGTPLRQRYKNSIEYFKPIQHMSDLQVAQMIRADEIDILVDLHGLSLGLRAGILGQRPAPIQMTYLGYIGTTMMPYIDYLITDSYSFTQDLQPYYSEQPILLDRSSLPTDRKRTIDKTPTRTEVGLPEDKFIFATFNNSYKLNETMFRCWINILHRVENSILWIVDDNIWATHNIKEYVKRHGLAEERLIFTPRVTPSSYLARMPLADVFLDNHPYNAGSTASDILWMGTPMVTLAGKTYVSRMAGSLLHYCGLDELITSNHQEYEELAVALSKDPERLAKIKANLISQREDGGAFDMTLFTKNLEDKFVEIASKRSGDKAN